MNVSSKSILIIDYEKLLPKQLFKELSDEGYIIRSAHSGCEAFVHLRHFPNLIIINPRLPDISGRDFLRVIKQQQDFMNIPVFILSEKGNDDDEIINLELGADYLINQPVRVPLLKARINALFRQQDQHRVPISLEEEVINVDKVSIYIPQLMVVCDKERACFPKSEFKIIVLLAKNRGKVLTRQWLFQSVRNHRNSSDLRIIDVYITHIRKKLKALANYIETVPGVGYKFTA